MPDRASVECAAIAAAAVPTAKATATITANAERRPTALAPDRQTGILIEHLLLPEGKVYRDYVNPSDSDSIGRNRLRTPASPALLRGDLEAVARLLEGEAEVRHSAGPGSLVARLDGLAAYSLPLIALGILAISLGARGFWGGWLPVDWNPKTSLRSICVGLLASAGGLIGLGGGIRAAFIALAFGAVAGFLSYQDLRDVERRIDREVQQP